MIDIEQLYGSALDCGAGNINDISCDCCRIHLSRRLLTRAYEKNYRQQKSCAAKGEVALVAFNPAFMKEQTSQRKEKREVLRDPAGAVHDLRVLRRGPQECFEKSFAGRMCSHLVAGLTSHKYIVDAR
jgi:hypothetical protein